MPVIWPRQFGDIGGTITKAAGDVGKGVTGAAGGVTDAADGVKKAADTAKEAGEVSTSWTCEDLAYAQMVDKAKEAYATYEEVQKKITYVRRASRDLRTFLIISTTYFICNKNG